MSSPLTREIYQANTLQSWDSVVIAVCVILIVVVGFLASLYKPNRGTVDGYFLASRQAHWLPVGLSIFVSNIGTEHFIGIVGIAAKNGVAVALYEIQAMFVLPILGWLFMPVYIASGVTTMPEYIKKRFGGTRICFTLALFSLVLYIFTKISTVLYAGTVFLKEIFGWDLTTCLFLVLAISAACTIGGGMTAVIATDTLQAFFMIVGTITLTIYGFEEVGGYQNLQQYFENATKFRNESVCPNALIPIDYTILPRPPDSEAIPGPGYIGIFCLALWYWCTDQVIVQRALSSRNLTHAKAGTILAGFLKLLPLFTLVLPGMVIRKLRPEIVACATPDDCELACGQRDGCSSHALQLLVFTLLPQGLKGMFVGVMFSALVSSLTSIYGSTSTIVTKDVWSKIRPKTTNKEQMIVGRLSVLVLVVASCFWILVISSLSRDSLYHHLQKTSAFLAPPIAALFVFAVFWTRTTEKGAFYGLMTGLILGMLRLVIEYTHAEPLCGEEETRPQFITKIHYLYYSIFLFVISSIFTVFISLCDKSMPEEQLRTLTFWSRNSEQEPEPIPEATGDLWTGELSDVSSVGGEQSRAENADAEANVSQDKRGDSESDPSISQILAGPVEDVEQSPAYIRRKKREEREENEMAERMKTCSWRKRFLFWLGGIESDIKSSETHVTEALNLKKHKHLQEKLIWKRVCDVACVVLLMLGAFVHIYWSIP